MINPDKPNGKQLVSLKNRVAAGFSDSNWRELGALTETLDMIERHPRLLRSLSWGDDRGGSDHVKFVKFKDKLCI